MFWTLCSLTNLMDSDGRRGGAQPSWTTYRHGRQNARPRVEQFRLDSHAVANLTNNNLFYHRHRDSKKHHQFGGVFRYIYRNYFANE